MKYLSTKTTQYILKYWKRSAKRKSNISFRVIKSSSFDQQLPISYMVKVFVKILWWQFLVHRSEHLLVSSATLSCKTQSILALSILVYYNTNCYFSKKFLFQFINNQGFMKWTSFWSFIVSCCSLISLLPNIVSSEEYAILESARPFSFLNGVCG